MPIYGALRPDRLPEPAERVSWLALASAGAVRAIAAGSAAGRMLLTDDAATFSVALAERRPRVVILVDPPAGKAELDITIRARRRRPSLRIVHVSPSADVAGRVAALRAGVDDAVADDIGAEELLGRLEAMESRAHGLARHELVVGDDIILDLVAHEVRRDGRLVHLRPKEFQLLALLATHPGRAYTRRQILDRVWGADHDGDPRTVDVHVRWLRSKLEPDAREPAHLVTVRGVGYRLDPVTR